MKPNAKKIVERIETAIRIAGFTPAEMREAATHIKATTSFNDKHERAAIVAIARLIEDRAEAQERVMRETYGSKSSELSQ